jgi:hypothetical protein
LLPRWYSPSPVTIPQSGLGERKRSGRPGSSRLLNLPVTLTISLLPSKGDAVYWGKTLVVQREDKQGMT